MCISLGARQKGVMCISLGVGQAGLVLRQTAPLRGTLTLENALKGGHFPALGAGL